MSEEVEPYKTYETSQMTRESDEKQFSQQGTRIVNGAHKYRVRPGDARFPLCIVWTPLPLITQIIPCIGHTGIGDSSGVIYDFAGPYFIGKDDLAFGETHKYVVLDLEGVTEEAFNDAIRKANVIYKRRMHNICCDNCHSHVARALNILRYKGRENYTMIDVWWMCLISGQYVACKHIFFTYMGWLLFAILGFFLWFIPFINKPN